MFELNGYWQKVGRMKGREVSLEDGRKGIFQEDTAVSAARGRGAGFYSTRTVEKFLSLPTFIRLGRKITL